MHTVDVSNWFLFWAPIWLASAFGGFIVTWVAGDLLRGRNPRWFELTRFIVAGWRHRRREYWVDYYTAKGDLHMARFVAGAHKKDQIW